MFIVPLLIPKSRNNSNVQLLNGRQMGDIQKVACYSAVSIRIHLSETVTVSQSITVSILPGELSLQPLKQYF